MIPSTSCTLDVPSHLIFHLLHNSYLPSNDFELMGYTVELLTVFLTRIHIFSSSIKWGGWRAKRYLSVRAVSIQSLHVWVPPVFWEWRDVIVCQSIPNPVNKEKLSLAHICGAGPAWRKEELSQGRREASVCTRLRSSAFQYAGAKQLRNWIRGTTRRDKTKRMDSGQKLPCDRCLLQRIGIPYHWDTNCFTENKT